MVFMNFKFKEDKYQRTRGKYSRLLKISCRLCGKEVCIYQKDGSGNLRRLYFDRIFSPKKLTDLEFKHLLKIKALKCPHCKEELGTPYVYQKENRKAFKLYQDTIIKKTRKLTEK